MTKRPPDMRDEADERDWHEAEPESEDRTILCNPSLKAIMHIYPPTNEQGT